MGSLAIQLAVLSGYAVIAVISDRGDEAAAKRRGATYVLKTSDPDLVSHIKSVAPSAKYAFDTVVSDSTVSAIASCLSGPATKRIATAIVYQGQPPQNVELCPVFSGEAFGKTMKGEVSEHGLEVGQWLWTTLPTWLESSTLSPLDFEVIGGLEEIEAGLSRMRNKDVSRKQVVEIARRATVRVDA